MPDVAIVLIPEAHTRVWKVSTEKVPHLTLLYITDPGWSEEQLNNVVGFVEHVAGMTRRLWVYPEERTTLGPKDADVVTFAKYDNDKLVDLRDNLLGNDEIRKSFNDDVQFPDWTPHVTLGYPDKPAKEIEDGDRLYGIEFDRLAIWTGDYEGPEFKLVSESAYAEAVMSGVDTTEKILEHYGVKGMRWGVRKARGGQPATNTPRATTRTKYKKPPSKLSTAELKRRIERMEMEVRYNKLNSGDTSEGRRIAQELLTNAGRQVAKGVLSAEANALVQSYLRRRR